MDCNIFIWSERLHRALLSVFGYMKADRGKRRGEGEPSLCVKWPKSETHKYSQSTHI